MNDLELRKERALLKIYSGLKNLETDLERLQTTCEKQLPLASSCDLDDPDTYLEVMHPISIGLKQFSLTIAGNRFNLRDYQKLDPDYTELKTPITDSSNTEQIELKSKVDYLENKLARFEKILFTFIAITVGVILGYISNLM